MAEQNNTGTPSKADLEAQYSLVESLKEVLGIKSKVTEAEKATLKYK